MIFPNIPKPSQISIPVLYPHEVRLNWDIFGQPLVCGCAKEPEESPLDKLSAEDLLKELQDDRTADVEALRWRLAR